MKAAVHARYGPPDVVRIAEVDEPAVGDSDVLVRVHATTVNRTDCAYRAARPIVMRLASGLRRPRRKVLGTEFAGVVEAVGERVERFGVGDRVFGYNEGPFGTHAEYVAVPEKRMIATVPEGLSFEEVAPGTEGSHYALGFLRSAKVAEGQHVLVYGATGGIGSAAVQLLKAKGIQVTAVCGTGHMELVRGLGADRVVDYMKDDFTADGPIHDAVFDAVGRSSFGRCKGLLKPGGVYLSSEPGRGGQNLLLAMSSRRVRFPFTVERAEAMREIRELIASGGFRPLIDRRYPLDEIVDAYRYVETGQKLGNVVINVR
ncbi:NAD(P)-dependent alcohol dehydrogenase [Actinomadura sp. NEAU-AAG7]|uniref:NAD(P)-dependent alcohol dehydrogenase n=1 Tax=Actinomadura sp. NEAU-AAG7 TaxID=2839640 RepID=UPI001BE3D4A9|nr:NAD(P)-dependent alcohol dehydrogenase [Actinomadura sp. NEAU-AAG7]MBT2213511.1 NAD(P)-dependent alcohol dehydrogenase [Actinomadura sp. NEAU-AAG7]